MTTYHNHAGKRAVEFPNGRCRLCPPPTVNVRVHSLRNIQTSPVMRELSTGEWVDENRIWNHGRDR